MWLHTAQSLGTAPSAVNENSILMSDSTHSLTPAARFPSIPRRCRRTTAKNRPEHENSHHSRGGIMTLTPTAKRLASAAAGLALVAAATAALAPSASATPALPSPVACNGCWQPSLQTSLELGAVDGADRAVPQRPDVRRRRLRQHRRERLRAALGGHQGRLLPVGRDLRELAPGRVAVPGGGPGQRQRLAGREVARRPRRSRSRTARCARSWTPAWTCASRRASTWSSSTTSTATRNSTGFPLTAADQLYYNATLANDSHTRAA